jgi:hypothetical protein
MADRFDAAAAELSRPGDDAAMAVPLLDAIPVTGAAISTLGPMFPSETISASDRQAARLDELQFDLGEGPCWDALEARAPVLEPDLQGAPTRDRPAFSRAVRQEPIAAMFAFPLVLGPLRIGAVDLYAVRPGALSPEHTSQALALAAIISRRVLRSALSGTEEPERDDPNPFSRRVIQQATGYVIAQLGVSADDAELLLQGRAFVEGRALREVAEDVIHRRQGFTLEADAIEDVNP